MTTINLKVSLINIDGTTNENVTLAKTLSELLATETEGKSLKLYGWYRTLMNAQPLQLDDADIADLIALVTDNKRLYIYIKGQILEVIKSSK